MRRSVIPFTRSVICLALVCLTLAACATVPASPRGQVVIAWHTLSGSHERVLLDLIDEWNRSNEWNITVVPERREPSAFHGLMLKGIAQNALPSLVLASPMQTAIYHQKGVVVPLNSLINDPAPEVGWTINDRTDLYPFMLKAGRAPDAKILGIPFGGTVRLMFYNVDWLKTMNIDGAPSSWEQFSAACNSATDRSKGTLCFGIDPTSIAFQQWLYAHGGQVTTDDMSVLQVSTPLAQAAMNRLAGFAQLGQAYRVTTRQQSFDDFASSRVLFTFDWSDQLGALGAVVKQRADFDWQPGLLPADEQKQFTQYQAPLWVITRVPTAPNPDREKAAWLFLHWLTANAQTSHWAEKTAELPARVSAINTMSARQPLSPELMIVLQQIAPLARPEPLISGWRCVENTLTNGLRQIFEGKPVTDTLQITQMTGQSELNLDCSTQ